VWIPFRQAVKRAGSLDALMPALRDGRVLARHGGLYVNGGPAAPAGSISPSWWAANTVRDIDPEANRAVFVMDLLGGPLPMVAIGIEVEGGPLLRLFPEPEAEKPAAKSVTKPAAKSARPPTVKSAEPEASPAAARQKDEKGSDDAPPESRPWHDHAMALALTIVAKDATLSDGAVALEIILRWKLELKHPGPRTLETFVANARKAGKLLPREKKQPSR
jgi:hypothetical protein